MGVVLSFLHWPPAGRYKGADSSQALAECLCLRSSAECVHRGASQKMNLSRLKHSAGDWFQWPPEAGHKLGPDTCLTQLQREAAPCTLR